MEELDLKSEGLNGELLTFSLEDIVEILENNIEIVSAMRTSDSDIYFEDYENLLLASIELFTVLCNKWMLSRSKIITKYDKKVVDTMREYFKFQSIKQHIEKHNSNDEVFENSAMPKTSDRELAQWFVDNRLAKKLSDVLLIIPEEHRQSYERVEQEAAEFSKGMGDRKAVLQGLDEAMENPIKW